MYTDMTVSQLRSEARNMTTPPASGVEISGANKEQLIFWLSGKYSPNTPAIIQPTIIDTPDTLESVRIYEPVKPAVNFNGQANDYLANLQSALQPLIGNLQTKPALDESRIVELIKEHQPKSKVIEVKTVDMPAVDVGVAHREFPELLKCAAARVPAMLVGPSGSGKTHACSQLAKALGLEFNALSCNPMTSKSDLMGFTIPTSGVYHESGLVKAYREGSAFLLDEIDASNASVLTAINMASANGFMATPDGLVKRHADFVLMAGANTWGNGATMDYVGRNKLDEATKNRFYMLAWDYDESIESSIAGAESIEEVEMVKTIQNYRSTARSLELRVTITPRDSINAVKLLRAGMTVENVLQGVVFAGLDSSTSSKIRG